jgi:NADP-dependent 3-hydroxy acid dehydrogenase YdfG
MLTDRLLPLLGSFRDQVVIITGASSGIGRETAVTFGRLGARVALLARRPQLLDEVAAAVEDVGGDALAMPTDVTDQRAVRTAISGVKRAWKRVDVLVNNAGIVRPGIPSQLDPNDLDAMMRVNLYGALYAMQAALPAMRAQKRGSIVNVSSLAGRRGYSKLAGYCATKFALVGLTEALRTELQGTPLHVGLVLPGVVETPMAENLVQTEVLPVWPARFNMPVEWVALATVLAVRFRLREISLPLGAATISELMSAAPTLSDAIVGWLEAAGEFMNRQAAPGDRPRKGRTAPKRR